MEDVRDDSELSISTELEFNDMELDFLAQK